MELTYFLADSRDFKTGPQTGKGERYRYTQSHVASVRGARRYRGYLLYDGVRHARYSFFHADLAYLYASDLARGAHVCAAASAGGIGVVPDDTCGLARGRPYALTLGILGGELAEYDGDISGDELLTSRLQEGGDRLGTLDRTLVLDVRTIHEVVPLSGAESGKTECEDGDIDEVSCGVTACIR